MVTTITYRPSLVKIDERNFEFLVTDPHTHKQTIVITTHCATASAQCKEKKTQMQKHRAKVFAMPAWVSRLLLAKLIIVVNASSWLVTSHQASSSSHGITTKPDQRCQPGTCQLQTVTAFNWNKLCGWWHNMPPALSSPVGAPAPRVPPSRQTQRSSSFPRPIRSLHLPHALRLRRVERPGELTFDLESGVWVTCDVAYLCPNFGLPMPLCSRLRPDVCDRQDVRQKHHLSSPPNRGGHN